jgi:hypothetical protein
MARTRAIRFADSEEQQIEEFLKNNSFLDFSSLARLAILGFIKEPRITVRPIQGSEFVAKARDKRQDQPEQ